MEFNLPDVGEGLADVEIVEWLVEVGQEVREDQPLVEVETDKAVVQITTPVNGRLLRQGAGPGDQLAVGAVLAEFSTGADDATPPEADEPEPSSSEGEAVPAGSDSDGGSPETSSTGPSAARPRATPATRGLARRLGVELATVTGTGPGGRITDADVRAVDEGVSAAAEVSRAGTAGADTSVPGASAAARPVTGSSSRAGTTEPLRGVRRVIAETMTQSWQTIPHVSSFHEVDMGALATLRAELKSTDRPVPLTAFLVVAAARALTPMATHSEAEITALVDAVAIEVASVQ